MRKMLAMMVAAAAPCFGAYSYSRILTVDHTKVTGTNNSFPVLVTITDSVFFSHVASSSCFDVNFFSDLGHTTKVPWEVELCDPANHKLIAWVSLPVTSSADATFYLYYGDSGIATAQNTGLYAPSAVWANANYAGVWHAANGATLSAVNSVNGTSGTITGATATAGQIDGGAALSGSGQYVNAGNSAALGVTGAMTIEAWVKPTDRANYNGILARTGNGGNDGVPAPYDYFLLQTSGIPQFLRGSGLGTTMGTHYNQVAGSSAPPNGAWSHVAVTMSGSNSGTVTHYLNGAANGSGSLAFSNAATNGGKNTYIGTRTDLVTMFKGSMDEVRLANVAQTGAWEATVYANTTGPGNIGADNFIKFGVEAPAQVLLASPGTIPANHAGNLTLSIAGGGTNFGPTTRFTLSGAAGAVCAADPCVPVVTDATHASIVVTTGSTTGILTITEGVTGSAAGSVTVATAALSSSSLNISIGASREIALTGVNTLWTQETPAGLFTVTGGAGASLGTPTILSDTTATVTLTAGSAPGTLTMADHSVGTATTLTVTESYDGQSLPIAGGPQSSKWLDWIAARSLYVPWAIGDTNYYVGWGPSGTWTFNGVAQTGTIYGTVNDGQLVDSNGITCGSSLWVTKLVNLDFNNPANTNVVNVNCMTSAGANGYQPWPPAALGQCTSSFANQCTWKSRGIWSVDGKVYLFVVRQEGPPFFREYDATILRSDDNGATWVNRNTIGSPNANGALPAGPGDASYPATIMWQSSGSTPNRAGSVQAVQMAQDYSMNYPAIVAANAACDPNVWVCFLVQQGNNDATGKMYIARVSKANMPHLNPAEWVWYQGGEDSDSGNWLAGTTGLAAAKAVANVNNIYVGSLCSAAYVKEFQSYLMTCAGAGYNSWAPRITGPWTNIPNDGIHGLFTGIIPGTATVVSSNPPVVDLPMAETVYNQSGNGSLGFGIFRLSAGRPAVNESKGTLELGYNRMRAMNAHGRYSIPRKGLTLLFDFYDNHGAAAGLKNVFASELVGSMGSRAYCIGFSNDTYNGGGHISWASWGLNFGYDYGPGCDTSGTFADSSAFALPPSINTAGQAWTVVYVTQPYNVAHNYQLALSGGPLWIAAGFQSGLTGNSTCFFNATYPNDSPCTSTNPMSNNLWYYKAISYSGGVLSANTLKFWTGASGAILRDSAGSSSYSGAQTSAGSSKLSIGSLIGNSNQFWGTYAWLGVWNRELQPGELLQTLRAITPALKRRGIAMQ